MSIVLEKNFKVYRHRAQYYETDQMGIIHHSNYIRWFEEARIDILDQMGFSYKDMETRGIRIPVLGVTCEFKSMVQFNDWVLIIPKIQELTNVKMNLAYFVVDEQTRTIRSTGTSKHCFLNMDNRPVSLKRNHQDIYELLNNMVGVNISSEFDFEER